MRVRARRKGFRGGRLRKPGEVFDWPDGEPAPGWVEPVTGKAPPPLEAPLPEPATPAEIESALDALDPGDDRHWTAKGLPSMRTLEALLKPKAVTRAEVHVTRPGFDRNAAREVFLAGLVRTVRQRRKVRRPA